MASNFEILTLNQMLARLQKYTSGEGCRLVEKAYVFAENAHAGQTRKSGEPYFIHPCFVASILTNLMIDPPTIAAGLLHDTVEDCEGITQETIRQEFGDEVAALVDGVTKLKRLDFANKAEAQAESLRKMILAMSKDIRVVIIKLADRLHNMRTLRFQAPDRQAAIARETLDIYAPLAHRLGVYSIKQELEDLSLRYIDPEGYQDLVRKVGMRRAEREASIRRVINELSQKLDELNIHYDIDGRPKHFYSIYNKMVLQHKPFEEIYDLIAIRVLVDTIPDCYAVLGVVHTLWNQMPGRFKDYISVPKPNMYQSLHTTLMGGRTMPIPFEVQIRTFEMHRVAEYGIAAHWRYKEGSSAPAAGNKLDTTLDWLRQILNWQDETRDSQEFMEALKSELLSEEVFIYTPKGDVVTMAKGATPLDFAYQIHSAIGNKCVGAKVNGHIVPLETPLVTGDQVEILTSSAAKGPSADWLRICKTTQAKSKIRQYLKKELRTSNIELGHSMLEHECHHRNVSLGELLKPEYYDSILKKYGYQELDDILAAVGYGGLTAVYVISRLVEEQKAREPVNLQIPEEISEEETERNRSRAVNGVILSGQEDMNIPVRFAKCCSPVPGDDIIGYITRGRGVTIHKAECVNALNGEKERQVSVKWASADVNAFCVAIKVLAYDSMGFLSKIAASITDMKVNIRASNSRVDPKTNICTLNLVLEVRSKEHLDQVLAALHRKADIVDAFRV